MNEHWQIELRSTWVKVSWSVARSWSGRVRLNGQPWYGPSALFLHGLPQPYREN